MTGVNVVLDQTALAKLFTSPEGPIGKALIRDGLRVQRHVKQLLRTPGRGETYKHGNVTHRASAPGDPPARDTGQLGASIGTELARDADGLVERIGTNLKKGRYLELGTRDIEPRPYLRPGLAILKAGRG
jgi:hypothetical protein